VAHNSAKNSAKPLPGNLVVDRTVADFSSPESLLLVPCMASCCAGGETQIGVRMALGAQSGRLTAIRDSRRLMDLLEIENQI
jgi:hypothetical protein